MPREWALPTFEVRTIRPRRHDVALVIPVLNEGTRLLTQLDELKTFADMIDVIIADGGSTDGSNHLETLEGLGVSTLLVTDEKGLGSALQIGISFALKEGYETILTMDGNGKDSTESIPRFLNLLQSGTDFVQGSRFAPGGESINLPRERELGIRYVLRPVMAKASGFPFTDPSNGFKGFTRKVLLDPRLNPFRPELSHFSFQFYLNYRIPRLGYRTAEIPVVRRYPEHEVPTKIVGWKPHARLLQELFLTSVGFFNPREEQEKSFIEFLPSLGIFLTFFFLALFMTPEILHGERPMSHDHAVHYSRAWQLFHSLLPSFRLWDWSFAWLAGYPTNYHYPILGDVLVCGFHSLFFAQLPFGFSYALVVFLVHFIEGYSVYHLGKTLGWRWAGFLGGVFLMTHLGGPMVGGWFWIHYAGVWPVSLSVSLSLFAISYFAKLVKQRDNRTTALVAIFWGLALLAHPLQEIHFLMTTVTFGLGIAFFPKADRASLTKRWVISLVLAMGLASLWTIPFFSASSFAEKFPDVWGSLPKLSADAWEGKLFAGLWPPLGLAGLIGILRFALSMRPVIFGIGTSSLLLIVAGSTTFFHALSLNQFSEKFQFVQYERFQMLIKPFWCLAAAYVLVKGFLALFSLYQNYTQKLSRVQWIHLGFVASLVLTILFAGAGQALHKYTFLNLWSKTQRSPASTSSLVEWIRSKETGESRFFRIATFSEERGVNTHGLKSLATEIRSPIYHLGYTPALGFKYHPTEYDETMLKTLSVRYFITDAEHPLMKNSRMKELERIGDYRVFEYKDWKSKRHTLIGEGSATESRWENRSLALDIAVGTRGKALFHVAHFDRWKARWNGKPVNIDTFPITTNTRLMSVTLPDSGGGRLELRYELGAAEYVGLFCFLISLGGCLYLLTPRKLPASA